MAATRDAAGKLRRAPSAEERRKAKDEIFFRELAMVCNVRAALKAAGMARQSSQVYDRRKRDPEFRCKWDGAVDESYAMLELEMLERGRHGDNRPAPATEAEKRLRELSDRQAMQLLRQHKSQVKGLQPHAQRPLRGEKLRSTLEKKLAEISRRLGGIG